MKTHYIRAITPTDLTFRLTSTHVEFIDGCILSRMSVEDFIEKIKNYDAVQKHLVIKDDVGSYFALDRETVLDITELLIISRSQS